LASSAEDIAGTWHSIIDSGEVQFNEDGTLIIGPATVNLIAVEFRFEGTRLFFEGGPLGAVCNLLGAEISIYEVELLENGNLMFTVIEDECAVWVIYFVGALIEREWEFVS